MTWLEYLEAELPKAEKRLEWNKHRGGKGYTRALDNRNQIKKYLAAERRKYSKRKALGISTNEPDK